MKKNALLSKTIILAAICLLLFSVLSYAADTSMKKGIWLRPANTKEGAMEQINNIKKAGFNQVYLETFYHGYTLFESDMVPIRPEMKGTDFLKLYVDECHKRGIEVHAWLEVFYWGVDTAKYPQFPKTTLFDKHPEWMTKLRDGRDTACMEDAHIFAEPAHPEVRKFMADFTKEIITKYKVDGINLDYIRYAFGMPDSGYSDYAVELFKKETGLNAKEISTDFNDPAWRKWCEWKEENINKAVREIKAARDESRKEVLISAAVFDGYKQIRYKDGKCQNWMQMIQEGLIDVVIPMAYNESLEGVEQQIKAIKEEVDKTKFKVALQPVLAVQKKKQDMYSGQGHPRISQQYKVIKKMNLTGFSVFCYDWMMDSEEGLYLL